MVTELTDQTFDEKTNNGVTFTDFWATWCGPCRMQSPVIEQLAEEMGDKVFFSFYSSSLDGLSKSLSGIVFKSTGSR